MPSFGLGGTPVAGLAPRLAAHPVFVPAVRGAWGLAVLVVVWQSLTPQPDMLLDLPQIDKVWHGLAYLVLALLAALSFPFGGPLPFALSGQFARPSLPGPAGGMPGFGLSAAGRRAAWSMALLGVGLELAQAWVPGRVASAGDMAANTAGVWCGVLLAGRAARRFGFTGVAPAQRRNGPGQGASGC